MQRATSFILLMFGLLCWCGPACSQTVVATVPVGRHPIYLAVDAKRDRIYVSNQLDNTVSVISGRTNAVIATVPVGRTPNGIAVDAATNRVYVANLNAGTVSVIDGFKFTTKTIRVGSNPSKLAVDTVTNRVYVTLENLNGALAVIDGVTRKLLATIPVPSYPLSVTVNPSSNRIYVADFLCGCGEISVIDGVKDKIVRTITVSGSMQLDGVALNESQQIVYATDERAGFYAISQKTGQLVGEVSGLSSPNEVAAIPRTTLAVEPDTGSNNAVFIDTSMMGIAATVAVGNFPTGVAVNGSTGKIYVANRNDDTVSVIDLGSR